jgi:hypothetical protein
MAELPALLLLYFAGPEAAGAAESEEPAQGAIGPWQAIIQPWRLPNLAKLSPGRVSPSYGAFGL